MMDRPRRPTAALWALGAAIIVSLFFAVVGFLAYSDCDPQALTALGGSGRNCPFYEQVAWFFGGLTIALIGLFEYVRRRSRR